jgi:hypothetical protein
MTERGALYQPLQTLDGINVSDQCVVCVIWVKSIFPIHACANANDNVRLI